MNWSDSNRRLFIVFTLLVSIVSFWVGFHSGLEEGREEVRRELRAARE